MHQPDKVPHRKGSSVAATLVAGMVAGLLGSAPADAASAVHLNIPSVVQGPPQHSMAAVASVIRDIRDRVQRDQAREPRRPSRYPAAGTR
jgi:hypothetical protein